MKRFILFLTFALAATGTIFATPTPAAAATCFTRSGRIVADGTTRTVGSFTSLAGHVVTLVATNNSATPTTTVTLVGFSSNSGGATAVTTTTFGATTTYAITVQGTGGGTISWAITDNGTSCAQAAPRPQTRYVPPRQPSNPFFRFPNTPNSRWRFMPRWFW